MGAPDRCLKTPRKPSPYEEATLQQWLETSDVQTSIDMIEHGFYGLCTLPSAVCCAECHQNPTSATLHGANPLSYSSRRKDWFPKSHSGVQNLRKVSISPPRNLLKRHIVTSTLLHTTPPAKMVNKTGKDFDPSSDIPSLAGKIILITGGTHDFAYLTMADRTPSTLQESKAKSTSGLIGEC